MKPIQRVRLSVNFGHVAEQWMRHYRVGRWEATWSCDLSLSPRTAVRSSPQKRRVHCSAPRTAAPPTLAQPRRSIVIVRVKVKHCVHTCRSPTLACSTLRSGGWVAYCVCTGERVCTRVATANGNELRTAVRGAADIAR